jgi:hypothetical protein
MAKFLTQSYPFLVPSSSTAPDKNATQLGAVNRRYLYLSQDPDFQALNPTNYNQFTSFPAVVLPGPSGADAIRQVWRWVLADADAVAFLNGTPDPSGMIVNPYYLPKGDPAAHVPWYLDANKNYTGTNADRLVGMTKLDGTAQRLTDLVLDSFPKNDETLMPLELTSERSRFDSIQFSPYAETLLSAARQAFRADPNSKTYWDPNRLNSAGGSGDWISGGAQLPGQKFMIAITDTVSAARWGLSTARVTVPNTTTPVAANSDGMTNALLGLEPTSLDKVTQVNPSKVPANGYPMTMVTYAAVNLTKTTAASRTTIADMLKQVTTTGQVPGSASGELPFGYSPLNLALTTQANTAVTEVRSYVPSDISGSQIAQDEYDAGTDYSASNDGTSTGGPEVTTGVDEVTSERTAATPANAIARSGLAVALATGLAGLLFAPILYRGRGLL